MKLIKGLRFIYRASSVKSKSNNGNEPVCPLISMFSLSMHHYFLTQPCRRRKQAKSLLTGNTCGFPVHSVHLWAFSKNLMMLVTTENEQSKLRSAVHVEKAEERLHVAPAGYCSQKHQHICSCL